MERLIIKDVRVVRSRRVLVESLNVCLEAGLTAVVGPNGSGKTSLLMTIAGLLPPGMGTLSYGRMPIANDPRTRSKLMSFVFQETPQVYGHLVRDVVVLGRLPHVGPMWSPSSRDRELATEAMEAVGISQMSLRPLDELSGGERRLVMLASARCQDAQVLLLDEPTAFLDVAHARRILTLLRSIARQARIVIAVLHDPNEALRYADQLIMLDGRGGWTAGAPKEVLTADRLESVYGVRWEILETPEAGRVAVPLA